MQKGLNILLLIATVLLSACNSSLSIESFPFGELSTSDSVTLYRLTNRSGASIDVIDYGCRVVRIVVPDSKGNLEDVVPGYDNIKDFEHGSERFFGALIGRYGNRVSNASFVLDGEKIDLTANENFEGCPGHLHGGEKGFDRVMWKAKPIMETNRVGIEFSRISPDGEEGYPGNLDCTVIYWWDENNVWTADYKATTDKPTIVNMSNHTYFNLKGVTDGGYVMDHIMHVNADNYLPNNNRFVPIGPILPVENTPFDLRKSNRIDYAIDTPNEHLVAMRGYSVCWALNDYTGDLRYVADLCDKRSGRGVKVYTTEPGLLTYTGRLFSENVIGKGGRAVEKFGGMLLETLHYADSPNNTSYPSTILRPGEQYHSTTEFHFYVK